MYRQNLHSFYRPGHGRHRYAVSWLHSFTNNHPITLRTRDLDGLQVHPVLLVKQEYAIALLERRARKYDGFG